MSLAGQHESTGVTTATRCLGFATLASLAMHAAVAQSASLPAALTATKPILDMRLRSENVDQEGMSEDAEALTLRGRVGFETGKAWNTALLVEADLLWPLRNDYNSTVNGKTAHPVVADAETYEINRLQLANGSLPGTTVIIGRQRINLDDQRFVGGVGFRQNEQTFDAVHVVNQSIPKLSIDIGYVRQANRVFGKDSPVGRFEGDNYIANLGMQTPIGKLTGFAYLLDFAEAPTESTTTTGVRLAGERNVSAVKLGYVASYAAQRERAGNPLDFSLDHQALEFTGTYQRYSLGAGIEVLGGDGTKGFATPLATLHRFQGWADKFLTTPPDGIDDRYVTAGYTRKGVGFLESIAATASYHVYESARLSRDYGAEIDLQLQARWRRFQALVKYADYEARGFATDTRKLWAQVEFAW